MARPALLLCLLLGVVLLAACAQPTAIVIPTVIALPSIPPALAATGTAAAVQTAVAPPTLPPTWTPAALASLTPLPSPTAPVADTTTGDRLLFVADGAIYIVGVDGAGFRGLTGSAQARDLALSPDGTQIVFVGAGSGSASEVYLLTIDSGEVRPLTALGYADVVGPSWHPDGQSIVFAAGQGGGDARDLFTVRSDGGDLERRTVFGQPPPADGTGDGFVAVGVSDPLFVPDGSGIVFAGPGLALLDLDTQQVHALTIPGGWGNDTNPRWRPGTFELAYISSEQGDRGYAGGPIRSFDLLTWQEEDVPPPLASVFAQSFQNSEDGRAMIIASNFGVVLLDYASRSARSIADTGSLLPRVTISPDGSRIAYMTASITGGAMPQLVLNDRTGRSPRVLMDVDAQVLGDLLWIPAR